MRIPFFSTLASSLLYLLRISFFLLIFISKEFVDIRFSLNVVGISYSPFPSFPSLYLWFKITWKLAFCLVLISSLVRFLLKGVKLIFDLFLDSYSILFRSNCSKLPNEVPYFRNLFSLEFGREHSLLSISSFG